MADYQEHLYTARPECTEQAIQQAATWRSAGYPVRFAIGPTGREIKGPGGETIRISHVQPEVQRDGRWLRVNGSGRFSVLDEIGDGQMQRVTEYISTDVYPSVLVEALRRWAPRREAAPHE